MNFIVFVLRTLGSFISIYTLLIFVRILLTWSPSLSQSRLGQLLAAICDPYLNWFKRFSWLRTSTIDFSPVLAVGILYVISSLATTFAVTRQFSLRVVFSTVIQMTWSLFSSFLTFFIIILIIRLVFEFLSKKPKNPAWYMLDSFISPWAYKFTGFFFPKGKFIQYKHALMILLAVLLVINVGAGLLINWLLKALLFLPV